MKNLILISLILVFSLTAYGQSKVDVYKFSELKKVLDQKNDTIYVINFWATWCKPCVKELPYFEKINEEFASYKVKVILVSLDFADELESRLIPFLKQREIRSQVILLDESNPNDFINKVNPKWSGAIPATVIFNKTGSVFYEQAFDYDGLVSVVELKLYEQ